jgi:hypothetical protein
MEEYKLYLTYIDPVDGESYSFYCNAEESDNVSTRFYCGVELLSDNYFAFNELNEVVKNEFEQEKEVAINRGLAK